MRRRAERLGARGLRVDGSSDEQIGYHVMLMAQAGLLAGEDHTTLGSAGPYWRAQHLTWAGHELLDAARNETTWNKAKSAVGGVAGFSLEILKNVLVSYGTRAGEEDAGAIGRRSEGDALQWF